MYKQLSFAVVIPCHNEARKIPEVLRRIQEVGLADEIIVVDDGSTDGTLDLAASHATTVLRHEKPLGVGASIRTGMDYVRKRVDVIVVMAGNNKDEPQEIPRLLEPILQGKADFVQGSRFLPGGGYGGAMPAYRKLATRLHPWLFSLLTGQKLTDSTNGFRAIHTSVLKNGAIHLNQSWLNGYELEPYLLYKVLTHHVPWLEVPVTKIYPPRKLGYTKMRPFLDWWRILKPLFWLRLGLAS